MKIFVLVSLLACLALSAAYNSCVEEKLREQERTLYEVRRKDFGSSVYDVSFRRDHELGRSAEDEALRKLVNAVVERRNDDRRNNYSRRDVIRHLDQIKQMVEGKRDSGRRDTWNHL